MTIEHSSIGLGNMVGFGRVRDILTAKYKNIMGSSRVRDKDLDAYESRYLNRSSTGIESTDSRLE